MKTTWLILFLALASLPLVAQQVNLPQSIGWNVVEEGKSISFKASVHDSLYVKHFFLSGVNTITAQIDSIGNFSWKPDFDVVSRLEKEKEFSMIIIASLSDGRHINQPISIKVFHVNRTPVIEDLPVFYARQSSNNTYQISPDFVFDPDGDPIVFKPFQNQLPEGASMTSSGLITWVLSKNQFNSLKNSALYLEFVVQDQPNKAEARGKIKIAQTQLDLPPEIVLVPGDSLYEIKEDALLNFKVYASDPNGDDNLMTAGFVSSESRISKQAWKENTLQQYEFTWTPGYAFVDEAEKFKMIDLTFFALDKSNNKSQKRVKVKILDAENLEVKDKLLHQKYRTTLTSAKNLIDLLDENHIVLTKLYKQAKKGKKQRAILNASLGATTGLSPLILQSDQSKIVSGIGGTTVLTLGTLEATEVIGKSKSDILDKMKINVEVRNQLQIEGDNFARKYALKSSRRQKEFDSDREKLLPIINNQKLVLLELDASKKNKPADNKTLKKTFVDFAEE